MNFFGKKDGYSQIADSEVELTEHHQPYTEKVVVIGPNRAGKSILIRALLGEKVDTTTATPPTQQHTLATASHKENDDTLEIQFIEISSCNRQIENTIVTEAKGSKHIILLYDTNDLSSLEALHQIITKYKLTSLQNTTFTLISCKDDSDTNQVSIASDDEEFDSNNVQFTHANVITTQAQLESFRKLHPEIKTYLSVSVFDNKNIEKLKERIIQKATQHQDAHERELTISNLKTDIKKFEETDADQPPNVKSAIKQIANCLIQGINTGAKKSTEEAKASTADDGRYQASTTVYVNPTNYFEDNQTKLETNLSVLQSTNASIYSTALNLLATTFAVLSVVGVPALWLSGVLKRNYEATGHSFMFDKTGHKQQAQTMIHKTTKKVEALNKTHTPTKKS